ncbi:hypothetical protein SOVF_117830 [Spinacia oleracea]|nr:hypothetical protein SOVF_117830 [Spinacia oleracea]
MGVLLSRFSDCLKKLRFCHKSAAADVDQTSELFFELRILQLATNFFSDMNLLGLGGFGPVYQMKRSQQSLIGLQEKADLLSYTWKLFQEGKALEIVDGSLAKCNPDEAAMCIQLGLLCCQATVADRPTMSSVHLLLCSESFTLPRPGKPGIHGRRWSGPNSSASTKTNTSSSSSGVTKTLTGGILVQELSRNSISLSSIDQGR